MDKVLLFDIECNGVDPTKDNMIEAAGVLFSLQHATILSGFTFVIQAPHNAAEKINGIPPAILPLGCTPDQAHQRIESWMTRGEAVLAHNGAFDRSFLPQPLQVLRPWVCTQDDVTWPNGDRVSSNRLVDLCLAHGIGIGSAHRALTDVMHMALLLERVHQMGHDLTELVAKAMRPKTRYKAVTGRYDPVETPKLNEKLKQHGFRFDPPTKSWWRRLVVDDIPTLQASYPFAVQPWPDPPVPAPAPPGVT